METRRMIGALTAAMLVFFAWSLLAPKIFPTQPAPKASDTKRPAGGSTTRPSVATDASSRPTTTARSTTQGELKTSTTTSQPTGEAPAEEPLLRAADHEPRMILLGSDDPNSEFRVMLKLNSRGAAVEDADLTPILNRYRNFPKGDPRGANKKDDPFDSYDLLRPLRDPHSGTTYRSLSTQEINIFFPTAEKAQTGTKPSKGADAADQGQWAALDVADRDWQVERRHEKDADVAVCSLVVEADRKPIVRLVKTYTLPKGANDLKVDLQVESLDGRSRQIILTQNGPVNLGEVHASSESRKVYYATCSKKPVRNEKGELKEPGEYATGRVERNETFTDQDKKKPARPVSLPPTGTKGKLLWLALGSQYFVTIMTPVNDARKDDPSSIEAAQTFHNIPAMESNEAGDMSFRFVSCPKQVEPSRPATLRFDVYLGAKERGVFQDEKNHAAYVDRDYMGTITGEYQWCVSTSLAELMGRLLIGLHDWVWPHNWGFAIIILVLIVRVLLHPLTKYGQVSMTRTQSRMAELQPKLDELKRKFGGDRNKLNQETMALYRKEGVNPASNIMTCLPMMLQMPIWIALWATLSNTIELRHASFMIIPGKWILDLSAPDAIYRFSQSFSLIFITVDAINILPFLWGLSMYLQQKMTPQVKTSDQMEQQQRMMSMMSVVFTVMFYNFPSGLTMYIMASNFFGILEQWRIRRHIAADKAKQAVAPPVETTADTKKPKGFLGNLMEKVEKFDEHQRRARSERKK